MLAMTMALLLAVAGPAMAGCQAKGAATTQEGRTTNRGATKASAVGSPQVVTALRDWGNNYDGQLGDGTNGNKRTRPVEVVGLRGGEGRGPRRRSGSHPGAEGLRQRVGLGF